MSNKTMIALAASAVLSLAATPAFAADNGIYLGASVGQAGVSIDETFEGENFDFDADSTAFKVIAGWRFLDWLAVEGNYVDLGSGDDTVAQHEDRVGHRRPLALGGRFPAGRPGRSVCPRRRHQLGCRRQRAGRILQR